MKYSGAVVPGLLLLIAFAIGGGRGVGVFWQETKTARAAGAERLRVDAVGEARSAGEGREREDDAAREVAGGEVAAGVASAVETERRVAKIGADYDAMRGAVLAAYGEAGENFPGGMHALVRQLALLERERRRDLAATLGEGGLEEIERRESAAGRAVARRLERTEASEAQRSAVFRLQRAFDEESGGRVVTTGREMLERERARQALQAEIRAVLGEGLFRTWLAREDEDTERGAAWSTQHGLSSGTLEALWQVRSDYRLARLELAANGGLGREQLRRTEGGLAQLAEARARIVLGPGFSQTARAELLGWLPKL